MGISVCGGIWEFWEVGLSGDTFTSFETRARDLGQTQAALSVLPSQAQGGPPAPNASRPALLRLSDHLLANYKKGVRPVRDWRTPTTVSIDVIVYAILSVVSARPHCPAPGWTF